MKIAFISTRGIPNNYGGFEQFAEHISVGLAARGHEVVIYSPHFHPFQEKMYKGVRIKHVYSPEKWLGGSVGSFIYDFLSLRDALKKEHFDIIYEAGYTSIIPAFMWYNVKKLMSPVIVTNMDGLEYKRTKFNKLAQKFILWEEKMAVKYSHYLVSDNKGIKEYYWNTYQADSMYLAYGANIYNDYQAHYLTQYGLKPKQYQLVIARLEPENNIEMIIEGHCNAQSSLPLVIIGKTDTAHGKYLVTKYGQQKTIRFLGGIYDFKALDSIRYFSRCYFHGHSVGGTNPSLLEAMAAHCFIIAHDNIFNRSVLRENAFYFSTAIALTRIINREIDNEQNHAEFIANNLQLITTEYSWDVLVKQHENYFNNLLRVTTNKAITTIKQQLR